ncbi:hypothetical protein [Methanoculleus chikugoensis]|uniref:hypothetical protein n=1 Tax=Methanoculleus chikugoensis TaxID=118126 RepID=UPI0006D1A663|nr:hypothetical protein [Methanoculleus chikugoensis]
MDNRTLGDLFIFRYSVEGSMPIKEYFGDDDWKTLESLPYAVSITVMAAAPSLLGAWGGETRAMLEEPPRLAAASGSELVGLVSAGMQPRARELIKEQQNLMKQDQMGYRSRTIAACRSAATALATVPPAEAESYKRWLLQIGEKVALAAKEHGVAFSDPEKAALSEIAVALGLQAER